MGPSRNRHGNSKTIVTWDMDISQNRHATWETPSRASGSGESRESWPKIAQYYCSFYRPSDPTQTPVTMTHVIQTHGMFVHTNTAPIM